MCAKARWLSGCGGMPPHPRAEQLEVRVASRTQPLRPVPPDCIVRAEIPKMRGTPAGEPDVGIADAVSPSAGEPDVVNSPELPGAAIGKLRDETRHRVDSESLPQGLLLKQVVSAPQLRLRPSDGRPATHSLGEQQSARTPPGEAHQPPGTAVSRPHRSCAPPLSLPADCNSSRGKLDAWKPGMRFAPTSSAPICDSSWRATFVSSPLL